MAQPRIDGLYSALGLAFNLSGQLRSTTQLDLSSDAIDIVARNTFRQTPLFQDYVDSAFDCYLRKAVAATGADRKAFLDLLGTVRPVSSGREQTAAFATILFGDQGDVEKINLAVSEEIAPE